MDDRETQRLAALARYDILDTPREAGFDEIADLAARLCGTPIAVVNLIGDRRQFFKAEVGLGVRETPFESSFCAKAILEEEFLLVPDATRDARFDCNPLVTGEPHLRFYAGALLKTVEGLPIGTLCVLDYQPRALSDLQQDALRVLARQAMAQLELRRSLTEQRQQLEAARASAERLRLILDSARDYAIMTTDGAGRITSWSAGAEAAFEWPEREAIGRRFDDLFTPEDRAAGLPAKELRTAAAEGCAPDVRWHLRADGSRVFMNGTTHPLVADETGAARGFLKIARNETDQRRQTDELARTRLDLVDSEARFRALIDVSAAAVWTTDASGNVVEDSPSWSHFTGQSFEQRLGTGWVEAIHPEDRRRVADDWRGAVGDGTAFDAEFRLYHAPSGGFRWTRVRATPLRGEGGGILEWVGMNTDIDDQKQGALAIAESEAQLRLATDAADIGLWDVDLDNDILFWPARVRAMFGVSPDVPVTLATFFASLHPDDTDRVAAAFAAASDPAVRSVYDEEYRAIGREDGVQRWIAAKGRGVFDAHGVCHRVIGTAIDITARKTVEQALQQLNETLEQRIEEEVARRAHTEEQLRQAQKMEAVGQLTGGIAHDFNNMLTGVIGGLDLIQRNIAAGRFDRVDRYIDAASTSAQRAAALTARLLAFGRRQSLDLHPIDVNALVGGMEDLLRRTLGEQVALKTALAADLSPALSDANQLESALLNLCINARDAMPEGGKLTIETANTHLDEHYASQQSELVPGDYVMLCVSDTGTGMAPSTMEKVFEPFFTTKPIGQGTGLGLSMIYGFARQSGGHVQIYSELGRGTTVKLYVPRHGGEVAPVANVQSEAPRGSGETVMIVEDDASVRLVVLEVLEALGYAAIEAVDGRSAIPILQSGRKIDLLVTDVGLPGMNGRQLAEVARQARPGLRVLFVTGYAESAAVRSGFLDQGMEMLTKPFAVDALATKIREMLQT